MAKFCLDSATALELKPNLPFVVVVSNPDPEHAPTPKLRGKSPWFSDLFNASTALQVQIGGVTTSLNANFRVCSYGMLV